MAEPMGLLSRITSLFGGRKNRLEDIPLEDAPIPAGLPQVVDARPSIFRPWARHDRALQNLSEGFVTLTQLMSGIKENLEKQNARQDELMRILSQLPQMVESIPEAQRHSAEALRTIYEQLARQNQAQTTLGEVLNRICDTSAEQRKHLEALSEQLDAIRQTDASISNNLASVGNAMQSLGQSSQTSTAVLQQLQSTLAEKEEAIHRMMEKQDYRFNLVFWASIVLSITTILLLGMVTYLLLRP